MYINFVGSINKELAGINPQFPGIADAAYKDRTEGTNTLESSPNVVDLVTSVVYRIFDYSKLMDT